MSDSITIPLGKQIAIARAERGITQKHLAEITGIAQPNISRWESGASNPNGASYAKVMEAITSLGGSVALDAANGVIGVFGRTGGALEIVDLGADPEPVEWLAHDFLARGYTTMIAGEGGSGKSYLTQTIAAGLANGVDEAAGIVLNGKQNRVLFVDAENGRNLVLERAKTNLGLDEEAYSRYQVAVIAKGSSFDLKYDFDKFRAIIADAYDAGTPYDVVVLDSMVSIWSGSENSVNDVRELFGRLDEIASKFGCAILVIHHTGKDGEYRGSSAIQGAVTCGLFEFTKNDGVERRLHCAKMRIASEPRDKTMYVTGHGVVADLD